MAENPDAPPASEGLDAFDQEIMAFVEQMETPEPAPTPEPPLMPEFAAEMLPEPPLAAAAPAGEEKPAAEPATPEELEAKRKKLRKWLIIGGAVAGVSLIGAASAFFLLFRGHEAPQAIQPTAPAKAEAAHAAPAAHPPLDVSAVASTVPQSGVAATAHAPAAISAFSQVQPTTPDPHAKPADPHAAPPADPHGAKPPSTGDAEADALLKQQMEIIAKQRAELQALQAKTEQLEKQVGGKDGAKPATKDAHGKETPKPPQKDAHGKETADPHAKPAEKTPPPAKDAHAADPHAKPASKDTHGKEAEPAAKDPHAKETSIKGKGEKAEPPPKEDPRKNYNMEPDDCLITDQTAKSADFREILKRCINSYNAANDAPKKKRK